MVVQQSYFDGGNQTDSTQYRYASLTALSGTPGQWLAFEADWNSNLTAHDADYLHTTDAVTFNDIFNKKNGWNERRRNLFIDDCVSVASRHIYRHQPFHVGILPYTVVMNLYSYMRAKKKMSKEIPPDATEILASMALNQCLNWGENVLKTEGYYFIFDQNEPYRGHVCDRVRTPKYVADFPTVGKIISIAEANMRKRPPLQLADLFAWCYAHSQDDRKFGWQRRVLTELDSLIQWLNYTELIQPIKGSLAEKERWKLPKRRPTR